MSTEPTQAIPRRRRRWWRALLVLAGVLAVVAATAPWWLPALVVRVAASYGVSVGAWESLGWRGTEYRDVAYGSAGVRVTAASVRVPLLGIFPDDGADGQPAIVAREIDIVIKATTPRDDAPAPSAAEIVRMFGRAWEKAHRWLPATRLDEVAIQADGKRYEFGALEWRNGAIDGTARLPWLDIEPRFSVAGVRPGVWRIDVQAPAHEASVSCEIDGARSGGPAITGAASWRTNRVGIEVAFGADGLLPESATLAVEAASLPSRDIGLEGYGPLTGSVHLHWVKDAYTVSVAAAAEPLAEADWPPLAVDVRAGGDVGTLRIDAIDVRVPGVVAALSRPLDLDYRAGGLREPVEFSIDVDLSAVSAIPAQGRLGGRVRVEPGDDGSAQVAFELAGSGLAWRGVEGARLEVSGRWKRTELALESAVLELGPDVRSHASAILDLEARTVREGTVHAVLTRAMMQALGPGLPPCERVVLDAKVEGPWARPAHQGGLVVSHLEWLNEREIGCSATWSGTGFDVAASGTLALAGGGSLPFEGRFSKGDEGQVRVQLDGARWVDDRGEWWRLAGPVEAVYVPASGEFRIAPWKISGDGFEASGDADVRWPAAGRVALTVHGLEGERIGGALPGAIRGGRIEDLRLQAVWDRGPVAIDGTVRATYSPVEGTAYAVTGEFVNREGGLAFASLEVLDESGAVLRGAGQLPLTLEGSEAGFRVQLAREEAISLDLTSEPNPVFWNSIAELTGWRLEQPRLVCNLRGSLGAPRGELEFSADVLRPPEIELANGGKLPELTGLFVRFAADEDGVSITQSMVAIDNRWLTLTGRAPWEVWTRWREVGHVAWRGGTFDLASNPMPIAIASRVFPTELAPVGEVSIKIAHAPESGLSGRIWLHSAALRPIGPLGSIRDVASELDFAGYKVTLTRLEGLLGGQPVKITGEADLTQSGQPEFGLHVTSSRVPLVRRAGLIVRTELDLELQKVHGRPARVTGRVDFGPSIYSADLLALMPSGVDSPETRPPYFSVEEQPFAGWELDVAAHGEAFLKLTTPFYKDLLSTDVKLVGTLGEPRVEGWVWGSGGVVSFPFGRIPVEQVLVTITRENPFEPQLIVSGTGRVLGYDIRMEASGPASEPRLLFTSDPPLTSQQVFLMLTTGAVPSDSNTIGTSDRASRLAFFLGRNIAAGLGLGGQNGGDERLNIRSGENFTREGRETIYVQYDFNHRWSIVGEYDRFDAYNGGIKFRIVDR